MIVDTWGGMRPPGARDHCPRGAWTRPLLRRRLPLVFTTAMPVEGEYAPSSQKWVRDQVEVYESSGGARGTTLRDTGLPVVIITNRGARSGKVRKTPVMRVEHDGTYAMKVEGFAASVKAGRKAFEGMKAAGAEVWATDCPLAALQFQQHAGRKPMHPMSILARAYREDGFPTRVAAGAGGKDGER